MTLTPEVCEVLTLTSKRQRNEEEFLALVSTSDFRCFPSGMPTLDLVVAHCVCTVVGARGPSLHVLVNAVQAKQ